MLLFIRRIQFQQLINFLFQYISCYSLSILWSLSMLLLLPFQYISCYSLSVKKFTIPSHICSFNTSHVTLYLFSSFFSFRTSCRFNTSHVTLYLNHREIWFNCNFRFNTSHVTLYRITRKKMGGFRSGFNTSHVTLYQNAGKVVAVPVGVSIHLMLLFISKAQVNNSRASGFQYISCYSLSKMNYDKSNIPLSFNTSHVTLYQLKTGLVQYDPWVSIHLMLLFINDISGRCR